VHEATARALIRMSTRDRARMPVTVQPGPAV
jgi:hypothetical protein